MSIKSKFFTKWGTNALKMNDTELALKMTNKAIRADQQDLKAYLAKFAVLVRMEQPEEALKILDQAIEMNPEDKKDIDEIRQSFVGCVDDIKAGKNVAVEYCNEGLVLLNQFQQLKESIKMFDKALEVDPQFAEAYLSKGSALGQLGQIEESIIMFDKVIEINPQFAKAYHNKGVALKMLGKHEEALQMFNKANEIDPELIKQ